jgi:hypothetical protein
MNIVFIGVPLHDDTVLILSILQTGKVELSNLLRLHDSRVRNFRMLSSADKTVSQNLS